MGKMVDIGDLIMLLAGANGDKIEGRTVVQKQIYFFSQLYDKKISFGSGYYGPYSRDVAGALASLVELGFLRETRETLPVQSEFEPYKYTYTLTEGGKEVLARIKEKHRDEAGDIEKFVSRLKETGAHQNVITLSLAAKVGFIIDKKGASFCPDEQDLVREAESLGWRINRNDIEKAAGFILSIRKGK